jgi:hypothetical protein
MNNTNIPEPRNRHLVAQFKDIGMQGYIGDKLTCSPLIRSFLSTFCHLHELMWCRTPGDGTLQDDKVERLSAAFLSGGARMLRLFIHFTSGTGSSSGPRRAGGGDSSIIIDMSVSKSKYATQAKAYKTTNIVVPRNLIGSDGGDAGDIKEQQAALRQRLTEVGVCG